MKILFGVDHKPKVNAILSFIDHFKSMSQHEVFTNLDVHPTADVGVYFNIHEDTIVINAEKYVNANYDISNRVKNISACNDTFVVKGGCYILRKETGHGNQSSPRRIYIDSDIIMQRFVDTSVNGIFYSGRVAIIGNKCLPMYACSSFEWNTNFHLGKILSFRDDANCFSLFPHFKESMFDYFTNWSRVNGLQLGALDFSIDKDKPIIWESHTALAFEIPSNTYPHDLNNQNMILTAVEEFFNGLEI